MSGKLTVYCPYYGNTGIGQINLAATGSGELVLQSTSTEPMTILEKPANNATASITFRLEGEDAPPSSGLPVIIDNNYTLTDVQNVLTNDGTKDVETGNGFSASLDYAGTEGWITLGDCNYDAATKKFTQHFTLGDNTSTESPRTGAVVVFSPSRREVARFIIKQEPATPPTIIDATNLAVGQSANCYIISKPGRYELPAYKGVHKDLTTAPKCTGKPYEVWNDSGNTINFLQANFSDNKIIFDVNSVNNGNALIAVRDKNNKILWSWHLWFCANGEPATETYPTSSVNMMDRNIGAGAQGEESPLYYQGGRKDPLYPSNSLYSSASGGSMDLAIANPSTFYKGWASSGWAAAKSQHDPCPPGYKVPSTSVWAKEKSEINRLTNMTNEAFLYNTIQPTIIYPYSGYLDGNGNRKDGTTGGITDGNPYTRTISSPTNVYAFTGDRTRKPVQFTNVTYKLHNLNIIGGSWAASNNAFLYGYESSGFEITGYSYRIGSWTENKIFGRPTGTYKATFSGSYTEVNNVVLGQNGLDDTALDDIYQILGISNAISKFFTDNLTYSKDNEDPVYGYQVRCVAE